MKRITVFLSLIALLTGCEKEETVAPQNYPPTIFTVTQQPGQRLTFDFSFNAEMENLLLIQKNGQVIASRNIDHPNALQPFDTGINTSGSAITYEITHQFKITRNKNSWLNGVGRTDTISEQQIAYEFDDRDAIDSDYDDAVVKVSFSNK